MIKYRLRCDQGHESEGWFRSSDDFEQQSSRGLVSCVMCGSSQVKRALMAPAVSGTRTQREAVMRDMASRAQAEAGSSAPEQASTTEPTGGLAAAPTPDAKNALPATHNTPPQLPQEAVQAMTDAMRAYRKAVVENTEDVGQRFADEARAMDAGEAPQRGIRGEASDEQVKELREDGIEIHALPTLPEDHN